ncbi:MAG: hypothetical protein DRP08_04015, partial [Candidatus Aenigmatarchaeota archaeon]
LEYNSTSVTLKISVQHSNISPKLRQLTLPITAITLATAYIILKNKIRLKHKKPREEAIKAIIIAGIIIRIILAPITMHVWDVTTMQEALYQYTTGQDPYKYVVDINKKLYEKTGLPLFYEGFTYPPHPLYIFTPTYLLYTLIAKDPTPIKSGHKFIQLDLTYPDIHLFLLLYKTPIIIAEAIIILILYKENKIAAALYASNPYPILISSVWGHFDPMVGLLLLLTAKTIDKKPIIAGLTYGLSIMKPYTIILAPLLLIHTLRKKTIHKFIAGAILPAIPVLHQLITNPYFIQSLSYHTKRQMGGANMLNIVHNIYSTQYILEVSRIISIISWVIIAATIIWLAKNKTPIKKAIVILMLTYLLVAPVNNEQYLASTLPLIALTDTIPILITTTPITYAVFNSPALLYFTTPLFWHHTKLKQAWKQAEETWIRTFQPAYPVILYTLGAINALALLAYTVSYIKRKTKKI